MNAHASPVASAPPERLPTVIGLSEDDLIVPVIVAIGARSGPNRGTLSRLQQDALCVAEI